MSSDGRWIVGESSVGGTTTRTTFLWNVSSGMQPVPAVAGQPMHAEAIARDGQTLAGWVEVPNAISHACLWSAQSGLQDLGVPSGELSASVVSTSNSGSLAAGWGDTQFVTFRWTAQAGMQGLPPLAGDFSFVPYAVSADGSAVFGESLGGVERATRWTLSTGTVPLAPEFPESAATAVNFDGSLAAGMIFNPRRAFRWSRQRDARARLSS